MSEGDEEIMRAKARRSDEEDMRARRDDGEGMRARRDDGEGMRAKARRSEGEDEGANQARRSDGGGDKPIFRKSLRNANINYRSGWFFVTSQVAHNKSMFGAIVGDKVVLNALGQKVWEYWQGLPEKYPELEIFESVLMPNHFHALIRIHYRATNREHHLGFLMSRFKGGSGYIYGKIRRSGLVEDIGDHLWQFDYWDDLVTSDGEFSAQARYIRENPANWSRDRYGACTSYHYGNLDLLNVPRIAFVASQGFYASELRPRKIWGRDVRAKARRSDEEFNQARRSDEEFNQARRSDEEFNQARRDDEEGADVRAKARRSEVGDEGANQARRSEGEDEGDVGVDRGEGTLSERAALAANTPIIISTFTSAQEREALRRALAKGRRIIQVIPQGIPLEGELSPALAAACREGRALLLSPQPSGSRLNKKVATWCNEYVLRHADEIWVGDISLNGMLHAMIRGLGRGKSLAGM